MNYESLVLDGITARLTHDHMEWVMGDLANALDTAYGENTLAKYANDIDVEYETLKRWRLTAKRYEKGARTPNLTWTHHNRIASRDDRLEWLARAVSGGWSVQQMLEHIRADDQWLAELEAATVLPDSGITITDDEKPPAPSSVGLVPTLIDDDPEEKEDDEEFLQVNRAMNGLDEIIRISVLMPSIVPISRLAVMISLSEREHYERRIRESIAFLEEVLEEFRSGG